MQYPNVYWRRYLKRLSVTVILLISVGLVGIFTKHEWIATLSAIMCCYLVCVRLLLVIIPERHAIVKKGVVSRVCAREERYMIWDPCVRGGRIVSMECGKVDAYVHERIVVLPSQGYQVCACAIRVRLEHILHINAWQRFYDAIILEKEGKAVSVDALVDRLVECVRRSPLDISGDEERMKNYLLPILANEANALFKPYGLIARVECDVQFARQYVVPSSKERR